MANNEARSMRLALLIDADNSNAACLPQLLTEITKYGTVTVRRSFRIPRMLIAPDEYPEFARFSRAADQAESSEIRVAM